MDNEPNTVADLIELLKKFPPNAVPKVRDDVGEFDPVVVWVDLTKVELIDNEVRLG